MNDAHGARCGLGVADPGLACRCNQGLLAAGLAAAATKHDGGCCTQLNGITCTQGGQTG